MCPEVKVYLQFDNDGDVDGGLCYDGASQCRKLEEFLVVISAPNDGHKHRNFYECTPRERHSTVTVSSYVLNALPIETEGRLSLELSAETL